MTHKGRSRRGETLVETLVAVLVVGMSVLLLSGMVSASMNINATARELDGGADGFYQTLTDVETHAFSAADDPVTVAVTGGPSAVTISGVRSYTRAGSNSLSVYGKEG